MKALLARGAERQGDDQGRRPVGADRAGRRVFRQQRQQQQRPVGQARAAAGRADGRGAGAAGGASAAGRRRWRRAPRSAAARPGVDRQFRYNELIGSAGRPDAAAVRRAPGLHRRGQGAARRRRRRQPAERRRQDQPAADRDHQRPLRSRDVPARARAPTRTSAATTASTPLYAVLNVQWAPKALYPQPRAYLQQKTTYLELMKALLDKGADVERAPAAARSGTRATTSISSGVDEIGATPFWRAAYAGDVEAMKLLVAHGADPNIPTMKPAGRPRIGDAGVRDGGDVSGLPPMPVGGPGVTPLQAAAGVGYGEGFAANSHRYAPTGLLAADQVPGRRARRRRQRRRPRRQHRAASRRGARRQRDDPVPGLEGRRRDARQPRRAVPPPTWPTARCSARSRIPKRSSCSRSWARRTTTSACRADTDRHGHRRVWPLGASPRSSSPPACARAPRAAARRRRVSAAAAGQRRRAATGRRRTARRDRAGSGRMRTPLRRRSSAAEQTALVKQPTARPATATAARPAACRSPTSTRCSAAGAAPRSPRR